MIFSRLRPYGRCTLASVEEADQSLPNQGGNPGERLVSKRRTPWRPDSRSGVAPERAAGRGDFLARRCPMDRGFHRWSRRTCRIEHLVSFQLRGAHVDTSTASHGSRSRHAAYRGAGRAHRAPAGCVSWRTPQRREGGRMKSSSRNGRPCSTHHGGCSPAQQMNFRNEGADHQSQYFARRS